MNKPFATPRICRYEMVSISRCGNVTVEARPEHAVQLTRLVAKMWGQMEAALNDKEIASVHDALSVAANVHHGQMRKSGKPYVAHVLGAAEVGVRFGASDVTTLMGTLYHDALEQRADLTPASLINELGVSGKLVEIIRTLTKDKTQSIDEYVYCIRQSYEASIGKLCDRIENLSDAPFVFPPWKVREYIEESKFLLQLCESKPARPDGYAETMRALECEMRRAMDRARLVLSLKARGKASIGLEHVLP